MLATRGAYNTVQLVEVKHAFFPIETEVSQNFADLLARVFNEHRIVDMMHHVGSNIIEM